MKKKLAYFIGKNLERALYVYMLLSLWSANTFITFLTFFSFLVPQRKKFDLILFPYAQRGSDGYKRRFEVYLDFLKNENISYKVCHLIENERVVKILDGPFGRRYLLFQALLWKRTSQVISARKYKHAFFQRGLFPFYPDQEFPYLERLLKRLNCNVTIDFWDADWFINPAIVNKAAAYSDNISCVNDYIIQYFSFLPNKKTLFPIGVDLKSYSVKKDYSIGNEVSFFYTGLPSNVQQFLDLIQPVFFELKKHFKFRLNLVTRYRTEITEFPIEFFDFDEATFYSKLIESDIGLYYVPNSDRSKGKMAMKVLDYMAAGLPCVATPLGLSPFAIDNENVLFAMTEKEWVAKILKLTKNASLRKKIGVNGREMVEKHHSLKNSYQTFKEIVFRQNYV